MTQLVPKSGWDLRASEQQWGSRGRQLSTNPTQRWANPPKKTSKHLSAMKGWCIERTATGARSESETGVKNRRRGCAGEMAWLGDARRQHGRNPAHQHWPALLTLSSTFHPLFSFYGRTDSDFILSFGILPACLHACTFYASLVIQSCPVQRNCWSRCNTQWPFMQVCCQLHSEENANSHKISTLLFSQISQSIAQATLNRWELSNICRLFEFNGRSILCCWGFQSFRERGEFQRFRRGKATVAQCRCLSFLILSNSSKETFSSSRSSQFSPMSPSSTFLFPIPRRSEQIETYCHATEDCNLLGDSRPTHSSSRFLTQVAILQLPDSVFCSARSFFRIFHISNDNAHYLQQARKARRRDSYLQSETINDWLTDSLTDRGRC